MINQADIPKNPTRNLNKNCHISSPKPWPLFEKMVKHCIIGKKISRFHHPKGVTIIPCEIFNIESFAKIYPRKIYYICENISSQDLLHLRKYIFARSTTFLCIKKISSRGNFSL